MVELLHGDCMEIMKGWPDKKFDLAIVDPPYGIEANNIQMGQNLSRKDGSNHKESTAVKLKKKSFRCGKGGHFENSALVTMGTDWDFYPPAPEYFEELARISKNQIIWGGNYFPLPPTRCNIVWDKMQPWENFSQVEIAWTSFNRPSLIFKFSNTGGRNDNGKIHPTQKPPELYKFCLSKLAKPGETILDTHSGSASIALACHDYGFDLVAIEKDDLHFSDALARFEQHKRQQKLFC